MFFCSEPFSTITEWWLCAFLRGSDDAEPNHLLDVEYEESDELSNTFRSSIGTRIMWSSDIAQRFAEIYGVDELCRVASFLDKIFDSEFLFFLEKFLESEEKK